MEQPIEQGRLAKGAVVGEREPLGVAGGAAFGLKGVDELEGSEILLEPIAGAAKVRASGAR